MTDAPLLFDRFHPLTDTVLSTYVATNIMLTVFSFAALLYIYIRQRHLFLRPSLLIAGFFHVFLQWPMTIFSGFYEHWLPRPWDMAIALQGCVALPLLAALLLPDGLLKSCWERMNPAVRAPDNQRVINLGIVVLGGLAVVSLGIYFSVIPISCTGLYAYIFHPEIGLLLREFSLKLLDSSKAAYAYTFYTSFISNLLFLFLFTKTKYFFQEKRYIPAIAAIIAMICVVSFGALEGSSFRFFTYGILLSLFLLWNTHLWPRLREVVSIMVIIAILFFIQTHISLATRTYLTPESAPAIQARINSCEQRVALKPIAHDPKWQVEVMDVKMVRTSPGKSRVELAAQTLATPSTPIHPTMRSTNGAIPDTPAPVIEKQVDASAIELAAIAAEKRERENIDVIAPASTKPALQRFTEQIPSIANRIWIVPFRVGSWYYHYAQTEGPIGIAGIPRLAHIKGIEPAAIGNLVGLKYGPEYYNGRGVTETINASSGFVFTMYAFFGRGGIALIFILIAFMDLFIFLIVRLQPPSRAIFLSFITMICLNLMQSDFGFLMYSGGLLPATAIIAGLSLTLALYDRYRMRRTQRLL